MKNHQFLAFGAWALVLALVPSVAQAGKPKRPSEIFGKPDGSSEPGGKGDHGKDAHDKGDGKPEAAGADADKPGADAKHEGRHEGFKNAMRSLQEQLKAGTLKKEDLKAQLAKLHDSSAERSKEHRQELGKRWGAALSQPTAREELKKHARRMAFLDRAMLLAQTEVTKDKDKVSDRITKLIDKENERHERVMEGLKSAPATPAAAAASAVPAAAPAASAAGDANGAAK